MAKDQLNEHIKKIMSKSNYVLESPSYRAIIDDDFESYDDPNKFMGMDGANPVDGTSPLREEDPLPNDEEGEMGDIEMDAVGAQPSAEPTPDVPAPEMGGEAPIPDEVETPEMGAEEPAPTPEGGEVTTPSPDELQNEIIKKNIDVMKQLNQKIEDLEMGIGELNNQNRALVAKNAEMEKDVEEVREPTNVEKLTSRKEDSHPYYYGLNDMWKGNWFQARRDQLGERGMKQLDDGSYVADFDEMHKFTDYEIKDSFDKF